MNSTHGTIKTWTVEELTERMSRPRFACGGGVAAALALAQAAALCHLVLRASRAHLPTADPELPSTVTSIRDYALALADQDRASLQLLLQAYRTQQADQVPRRAEQATLIPLRTADAALQLLDLMASFAPYIPPFAASDLAAARALSEASVRAALAMAEANLSLLDSAVATQLQQALAERRSQLEHSLNALLKRLDQS